MRSLYQTGLALVLAGSLSFIGCGGSSDGGSSHRTKPINYAPTVTITSPQPNAQFYRGTDINFIGSCSPEDPITASGYDPVTGLLPSGLDGLVGSATVPLTSTLGDKVLTAYCTDYNAKKNPASTTGENSVTIIVLNNPPVANAGNDIFVPKNIDFVINATNSSDIDGTIVNYELDFTGDGVYETSNTTGTFNILGYPFDACLISKVRVTDNDGATSTDTTKVEVGTGKCL